MSDVKKSNLPWLLPILVLVSWLYVYDHVYCGPLRNHVPAQLTKAAQDAAR
jgi:hypothetical protein